MNTGLISSRYATTLLEFSIENGEQDEVYNKLKLLVEVFTYTPLLRRILSDRTISISDKKKFILTACDGRIPVSLDKMFDLILKNDRQEVLHFIALQYIEMYRKRFKIQDAKLTTAYAIEQKEIDKFLMRIEKIVDESIELETETNPDIIGGFILQLGDYRWDASLSSKLAHIKNTIKGSEEIIKLDR